MEAQVVAELGETVGHAINALESKRALVSDDVVELAFRVSDPDVPFVQLVRDTGCRFELDNVLSRTDGTLGVFFTTRGASPEAATALADRSLAFSDIRLVDEDGEDCVFEATANESAFVATLVNHGAVPQTITAEGDSGRVVALLPTGADVREFVEMLRSKYDGVELTARRTRDRPRRSPSEFKTAFEDRITDRQREVLQTAYFAGFFDSPRKNTGKEVGELLGVSQPTVNHHLRASQRELLGMLYDERSRPALDR